MFRRGENPRLGRRRKQILFHSPPSDLQYRGPGNQYHIHIAGESPTVKPESLPKKPFRPRTVNGPAKSLLRGYDSEPQGCTFAPPRPQNKEASLNPCSSRKSLAKRIGASEPAAPAKPAIRCRVRLLFSHGDPARASPAYQRVISRARPFRRRLFRTFLPPAVAILARNPTLFLRFLLEG